MGAETLLMLRKIWFFIESFFLDSWRIFTSREKLQLEKETLKKELEKIKKENPDIKLTKKDQEFYDWLQNRDRRNKNNSK